MARDGVSQGPLSPHLALGRLAQADRQAADVVAGSAAAQVARHKLENPQSCLPRVSGTARRVVHGRLRRLSTQLPRPHAARSNEPGSYSFLRVLTSSRISVARACRWDAEMDNAW